MREICTSGSEGGGALTGSPYLYKARRFLSACEGSWAAAGPTARRLDSSSAEMGGTASDGTVIPCIDPRTPKSLGPRRQLTLRCSLSLLPDCCLAAHCCGGTHLSRYILTAKRWLQLLITIFFARVPL